MGASGEGRPHPETGARKGGFDGTERDPAGPARSGLVRTSIHTLSTLLGVIAATMIIFIMVSTAADVTSRQLTGSSIPGVVEYSEVLMVGLIFLGLPYAQRVGAHIGVDLVTERMPVRVAHVVRSVGLIIAIVVIAIMGWTTLQVGLTSFESREFRFGLVQVPIWPARLLIPIGLGALLLELAVSLYDEIVAIRRDVPITGPNQAEAGLAHPVTVDPVERR